MGVPPAVFRVPRNTPGPVLSGLLAAMRQPNELRKFRSAFSAVEKMGPDDVQSALDLAKKSTGNEWVGLVPMIVASLAVAAETSREQ